MSDMAETEILKIDNVSRHYGEGETRLDILKDTSFTLRKGEIVGLVAPSGTGKSTLLHLAGLLERPDEGEVFINGASCGQLLSTRTARRSAAWRSASSTSSITFCRNSRHSRMSLMPQMIAGLSSAEAAERAQQLLEYLRVGHRSEHRPAELSGGEQQRVAICARRGQCPPAASGGRTDRQSRPGDGTLCLRGTGGPGPPVGTCGTDRNPQSRARIADGPSGHTVRRQGRRGLRRLTSA
ncbi:MAG: ATP-binding cassette domain-containing protein [Rhizobium sp.]|nr:ATP-binding cassette domain-containing protein [Rhizobium sp.]